MDAPEPAAVTRFKEAHSAAGGGGRVVILPDTVHTAGLAAEALGCEVGAIANSLLFDAAATAERIGVPALKRASPEFVRAHTSQVIGGVSPLGHPAPVSTWLDVA